MKKTIDGFILSRQWQDFQSNNANLSQRRIHSRNKHLRLIYWLKTDEGPVKLCVDSEDAVFFVPNSEVSLVCELLKGCSSLKTDQWRSRSLELKSFEQECVAAFYFSQQRALYIARDFLRNNNVFPSEADIQPAERYLMERFVTGAARVEGQVVENGRYLEFNNPKVRASDYLPPLKVISLDIETSIYDNQLYSIAAYVTSYYPDNNLEKNSESATESCVFMCGEVEGGKDFLSFFKDEKKLFLAFLTWFDHVDPDIIIGWNVINFDLRFLQKKADSLGLSFLLGRENAALDWRQSRDDSEYYTLTVPGRAVLDGIDTLKSATYNFESFSLQNVANSLLNRGKLIHDVDDRGQEITRLFKEDKLALANYNLEDCRLVWDIFCRTQLIGFSLERSKMTGLAMDRFGGSVAAFDNQYLPRLHRKGYVAPVLKQNPEGVGSPGGYVMESRPGIYKNVLVLDFKSLYPSIIRTFKIDPLALALARTGEAESELADFVHYAPGFNGASFDKKNAILPELIGELWSLRDIAKQKNNEAMSRAIKILMNSFYGVLGTPGCRFFDSRLPSSITLRGHEILRITKGLVEDHGYQVIYGDTDSLFVWMQNQSTERDHTVLFNLGKKLTLALNEWWLSYLQREYKLHSFLELEFESCFSTFVMPTIRGTELGSKKRYAGLKVLLDGTSTVDDIVFKGLEAVRTDWTILARDFQKELYRRIFFEEPYEDFIRQTVSDVYSGRSDDKLVYRKRIRRRLDDYVRNVPPHVQAARIADECLRTNGRNTRYHRGGWIQYIMTINGPEPLEFRKSQIDYELYVERQITPIVDGILQFMDSSYDRIAGKQLGFF